MRTAEGGGETGQTAELCEVRTFLQSERGGNDVNEEDCPGNIKSSKSSNARSKRAIERLISEDAGKKDRMILEWESRRCCCVDSAEEGCRTSEVRGGRCEAQGCKAARLAAQTIIR